MAKIIEKPPIYQGNTYDRLDQLRDYLFRIAEEINDLERSIIGSGNGTGSAGSGNITVDQALNVNSANAVANSAVAKALNGKVNGSELSTVGRTGDYNDLTNKPVIPPSAGVDTAMSSTSENAVQNKVIKAYVDGKVPTEKTRLSQFTDDLGSTPVHTHSQYLTEHQSLDGYATEDWVEDQGYLTEHQSLAGYVQTTDSRLSDARTPLPHNHDERYYTEAEVIALLAAKISEPTLEGQSGFVLATDGAGARYWKEVQGGGGTTGDYDELVNKPKINNVELGGNKTGAQLGLASNSDIPTALSELTDDLGSSPVHTHSQYLTEHQSLAGYALQSWVQQQGYLTEHQSLADYAKTADLATVATSGSYNDLTDKPVIPEPGGTLEVREISFQAMGFVGGGHTFRETTITGTKTPVGVVGFYTSNSDVIIDRAYINSSTKVLRVGGYNTTSSYLTVTLYVYVLLQ